MSLWPQCETGEAMGQCKQGPGKGQLWHSRICHPGFYTKKPPTSHVVILIGLQVNLQCPESSFWFATYSECANTLHFILEISGRQQTGSWWTYLLHFWDVEVWDFSHKGDGLNSRVYCSSFKKGYRLMEIEVLLSSTWAFKEEIPFNESQEPRQVGANAGRVPRAELWGHESEKQLLAPHGLPGPAGERQPIRTESEKTPDRTSALSHHDVPLVPCRGDAVNVFPSWSVKMPLKDTHTRPWTSVSVDRSKCNEHLTQGISWPLVQPGPGSPGHVSILLWWGHKQQNSVDGEAGLGLLRPRGIVHISLLLRPGLVWAGTRPGLSEHSKVRVHRTGRAVPRAGPPGSGAILVILKSA